MALVDKILEESEAPKQVTNNQLEQVSRMAQEQLDIMGFNMDGSYITSAPNSTAVGELSKWAKSAKVCGGDELAANHSISELASALVVRLGQHRMLSQSSLPDVMASLELTEFKLANGFKVKIVDEVTASILKDREEEAAKFLESIGCGDVVKDEVKIILGKGERDNAKQFMEFARSIGVEATEKLSVHFMTLKSLVKEQLGQGVEFPPESFSVHPYKKTDIKPAKK